MFRGEGSEESYPVNELFPINRDFVSLRELRGEDGEEVKIVLSNGYEDTLPLEQPSR
jgi:hypothetical protein